MKCKSRREPSTKGLMEGFQPLMKAGKIREAEAKLDRALQKIEELEK